MKKITSEPFVRVSSHPWSLKFDELLSDGEWHDGRAVVREAEKAVTPGIALRKFDQVAASRKARRVNQSSSEEDEEAALGEDPDDGEDEGPSLASRIARGKDILLRKLVSTRINRRRCEIKPHWPLSRDVWVRPGAWEIRDVTAGYLSLKQLALRYPISAGRLRELVLAEPAIPHETVGLIMRMHQQYIPELDRRAEQYREAHIQRQAEANRTIAQMNRLRAIASADDRPYVTKTELGIRYGLGTHTVTRIFDANPQLDVEKLGRTWHIPKSVLPEWEKALHEFRRNSFDRRSEAGKMVRRRNRPTT